MVVEYDFNIKTCSIVKCPFSLPWRELCCVHYTSDTATGYKSFSIEAGDNKVQTVSRWGDMLQIKVEKVETYFSAPMTQ